MKLPRRPNIKKLEAKADVAGLIVALDYQKDGEVREAAIAALVRLAPSSIEPLTAALKQSDWYSRSLKQGNAAKALAQIGDAAVGTLVEALADGTVRQAATDALARIGAAAVGPLSDALREGDWEMRMAAGRALQRLGGPAVEPLVAALADESAQLRVAAAEALAGIGDVRALQPLKEALGDGTKAVRSASVKALEKLSWEPDGGGAGAAYWADKREWARCVEIGTTAVEPLISVLQEADEEANEAERTGACAALGEIGDPRAREALLTALGDKAKRVRRAAAQALGEIGDAGAIEPLVTALKDKTKEVRDAAATALEKLGWQAEVTETGASFWVAKARWDKCVELGALAVEPLAAALKDRSSRLSVARTLGEIGDPRALEPLLALLAGRDEGVREAASRALAQIGDIAVEPLIGALSDADVQVRLAAAQALAQIRDARVVEPLAAALEDRDKGVRREAARILVQIGDERAVEPLIAALKDEDEEVRETTAEALRKIGDARAQEPLLAAARAIRGSYRFARANAQLVIQFSCQSCGKPIAIKLEDIKGPFTCRGCSTPIAVPRVSCYYAPSCSGTYAECGGSIVRLPDEELAREEAAAWEGFSFAGARPTDDWHEELGDIERRIIRYECKRCGQRLHSRGGQTRCRRTLCNQCGRIPPWDQLPRLG